MFAGKSKIFLLNPDLTNCYIKWNFHCIIKKLCLLKNHCVILKILQTSSLIGRQALSRALIGWGHQAFTIMLNQFYKTNGSLEKYIWKFWRILNLAWGGMYGAISRCLTDKLSIGPHLRFRMFRMFCRVDILNILDNVTVFGFPSNLSVNFRDQIQRDFFL